MKRKLHDAGSLVAWELESLHVVSRVLVEASFWLILGISVFMLLPAAFFHYMENDKDDWDYTDAVYYTFITLSTIGFGDMVASRRTTNQEADKFKGYSGPQLFLYDLFIVVWIVLGMGYIFMIVTLLAQGLQSTGYSCY